MKSWVRGLMLALLLLISCAPQVDKDAIVVWTAFDGTELETLQNAVARFETDTQIHVELLKVPFGGLQGKMLVAGPARQGPDLLIGPHDWIGLLKTAQLLAPIPRSVISADNASYYEVAKRAVTFDGEIYSAPLMMECVVLARNTALCPEAPTSLESLVAAAVSCRERNPGIGGFAYQMDNFYFSWPFMAGFGADFLAPLYQGTLDVDKLKFDTPEAVDGANWIADLGERKYKLVPRDMNNETAVELFLKGRMGMILCGPWNLGAIRDAKVPYALQPLPAGPAGPSSPFVGVTGLMLSRYSADKRGVTELIAYLSSPDVTASFCKSAGRAPTRKETAQKLTAMVTDPNLSRDLALFSQAAQTGTPMPNHPAMNAAVNSSMEAALQLIISNQVDTANELARTTERVRAKIRFMTE